MSSLLVRFDDNVREALRELAAEDRRNETQQIQWLIQQEQKRRAGIIGSALVVGANLNRPYPAVSDCPADKDDHTD